MIAQHPLRIGPARLAAAALAIWGCVGAPARAGTLDLQALRPLDFGALVVLGSGSKQVDPDGIVTSTGLATVSGQREGPAEFTLAYRPDGQTRSATVMFTLGTGGTLSSNGSTGTLASLTTDFPGLGALRPGETRVVTLPPCAPPQCDTVFRIGGRLTVSGGSRQTTFSFPLQVTARLLAER